MNNYNSGNSTDEFSKPRFYTSEIESLVDLFLIGKKDIEQFLKINMIDRDQKVLSKERFKKILSNLVEKSLEEKSKSSKKFIVFLDYSKEEGTEDHYRDASILSTVTQYRGKANLGLLCFYKSRDHFYYYCLTPKETIQREWIETTFTETFLENSRKKELSRAILFDPNNFSGSIFKRSSDHVNEASVEVIQSAQQFITQGCFDSESKVDEDLLQFYQTQLANTFYANQSLPFLAKDSAKYFLPLLIGFLIFSGGRFAEGWMAMSRGQSLLVGTSLPINVMRVVILLSVRPLEAINMLGAVAFGARHYSELGSLLRTGWIAALITAVASMPVLLTSEMWLVSIFQQDPFLAKQAGDFLRIYCCAMPALTLSVAVNNLLVSTNKTGIVALTELGSVLVGGFITYVLVVGAFGIQPMGLVGYAWSLVLQKWANFFMIHAYLFFTRHERPYTLLIKPELIEVKYKLKLIFRKGLPLMLQIGGEQLYLLLIVLYGGLYGLKNHDQSLAQANIITEYFVLFSMTVSLVVHKTLMQKIGEVRGRDLLLKSKVASQSLINRNLLNIPKIILVNTVYALTYGIIIAFLFGFSYKNFSAVYLKNSDEFSHEDVNAVEKNIGILFQFLSLSTVMDLLRNVVGGALNGLGDVDSPVFSTLMLTILVGGGLGAFLCFYENFGLPGAMISSSAAYFLGGAILIPTLLATYKELKTQSIDRPVETIWSRVSDCCSILFKKTARTTAPVERHDRRISFI